MTHLDGRNILVTGGSRGIGAAIVEAIARDGARPIIHYGSDKVSAEQLLNRLGGKGWVVQADLSDPAEPTRLFAEAVHIAGRVHGLVNNAGIRSEVDISADLDTWHAAWAREMQVNFLSAVDLCKAALLHFRQQGDGHVVNMSSRAGQGG